MHLTTKSVHVMGDIHGEAGLLNRYINKHNPEVLILLGDCAFYWNELCIEAWDINYPKLSTNVLNNTKPQGCKIFWLPGNHEAYDHLDDTFGRHSIEPIEIKPYVYYCPKGSSITLNGKTILFCGGAFSYDYCSRTEGIDLFKNLEQFTESDYKWTAANNKHADIICSHTVPTEFFVSDCWDTSDKNEDPTRKVLSKVLDVYKPEFWFGGHWHRQVGGVHNNTYWQILNCINTEYANNGKYALDVSNIF